MCANNLKKIGCLDIWVFCVWFFVILGCSGVRGNKSVVWSQPEEITCVGLNCENTVKPIWTPVYVGNATAITPLNTTIMGGIDSFASRSGLQFETSVAPLRGIELVNGGVSNVEYHYVKEILNATTFEKKSDLLVPVQQVTPILQHPHQELYYNNVINQYYTNGTDAIPAESYLDPYTIQVKHDNDIYLDDDSGEIPPIDQHQNQNQNLNVEVGPIVPSLIALSIMYMIFAVLSSQNNLEHSSCGSRINEKSLPLWEIYAENPRSPLPPFLRAGPGAGMQKDVFNMFTSYGRPATQSNDDEDPSERVDLGPLDDMCPRDAFFYGMSQQHMQAVNMITDLFMQQRTPQSMMAMANNLLRSPQMNPKVWYTAMMQAAHERDDMNGLRMPGPMDAMPDTFIPGRQMERIMSSFRSGRARSHKNGKKNKCIRVDGSAGLDNGRENKLWYFREDVMVNSHHWYWHLSFPLMNRNRRPIDRRGELFYYTHRSMTARYNIERLCNGMEFVHALPVYRGAPIHEGYNAHLTDFNSGRAWSDRPPFTSISDLFRQRDPSSRFVVPISNWLRSRDRILQSIKLGYFVARGSEKIWNRDFDGIDILGNTLEAIDLSINPEWYDRDGYHNNGHRILGFAVDPNFDLRLPPGPMADPATAMRDPIFYRWHTNTNNIFEKYKFQLKPYYPVGGELPLIWDGVKVKKVSVISHDGRRNNLNTFFSKRKFGLSLGLAFNRSAAGDGYDDDFLKVCTTHLDHEEFEYEIVVDRKPCAKSKSSTATFRIFLSPRYNLNGRRFTIHEQRRLFVHLDLFSVELRIGRNVIKRRSIDSTLTIPWTQSLQQLQTNQGNRNSPNCGCGWPHHLLLPMGTPKGMDFDLFVMVTNGDEDRVKDDIPFDPFGPQCDSAFLYCGIQGRRFPDARPMGYPFDRKIYTISRHCTITGHSHWSKLCSPILPDVGPKHLEDYTRGIHNMGFSPITITHIPH